MPLYEFVCIECRHRFELRRAFDQAHLPAVCTACGSERTRKSLGAITIFTTTTGTRRARVGGNCRGCGPGSVTACNSCLAASKGRRPG